MKELLKYEFRKTKMAYLAILSLTGLAELCFLIGVALNNDVATIGMALLILAASFGILIVGLLSIVYLHRELTTKQSYMLFLIPRSSYQVLGAKVLTSFLNTLLFGLFYALLAVIDAAIAGIRVFGIHGMSEAFTQALRGFPGFDSNSILFILSSFGIAYISWFFTVMAAYFAIILHVTVLGARRHTGLLSFLLFLVISVFVNIISMHIGSIAFAYTDSDYVTFLATAAVDLVFAIIFYVFGGWLMERKLSV